MGWGRKPADSEIPRRNRAVKFSDLRSQGVFERIEDKFFVPREKLEVLSVLLEARMSPSYLNPETQYCGVESIYMDSSDLNSYTSHFKTPAQSGSSSRFKIRIRRYFPDGKTDPHQTALLELKSKIFEDGVSKTKKLRFSLGLRDLARLMKGKTVQFVPRLLRLNPSISSTQLFQRLRMINSLIRKHSLKPICRVSYIRKAFESPGLRVTYDDRIEYQPLVSDPSLLAKARAMDAEKQELASKMAENFRSFDGVVLEIKHGGEIPAWLSGFLESSGCNKISFSKYCYTMTDQLLASTRGSA